MKNEQTSTGIVASGNCQPVEICVGGGITGLRSASANRPKLVIIPKGFTDGSPDIERKIKLALGEETQIIWLDNNQVEGLRIL